MIFFLSSRGLLPSGLLLVFSALILLWLGPTSAGAAERIALVVGAGVYQNLAVLANPPNDARLMAKTLRAVNFRVLESYNPDRQALLSIITDFRDALQQAGENAIGLFFYAGHGVQFDGRNFMVPADARFGDRDQAEEDSVAIDWVMGAFRDADTKTNLVILDACRNNPFEGTRSTAKGLAPMDAPSGTLISYATAPGALAADGRGDNSPFTSALAATVANYALPVERAFKQVRILVEKSTDGAQTPWESSSLKSEFYFTLPEQGTPEAELAFWKTVQTDATEAMLGLYLERYPKGNFAVLARQMLNDRVSEPSPPIAEQSWLSQTFGRYEGSVSNTVRSGPDKVVTILTSRNGRLSGEYQISEPEGTTRGVLSGFQTTGERKGVFRWRDIYGAGTLEVAFSKSLRSFGGSWVPDGYPDSGGKWEGTR